MHYIPYSYTIFIIIPFPSNIQQNILIPFYIRLFLFVSIHNTEKYSRMLQKYSEWGINCVHRSWTKAKNSRSSYVSPRIRVIWNTIWFMAFTVIPDFHTVEFFVSFRSGLSLFPIGERARISSHHREVTILLAFHSCALLYPFNRLWDRLSPLSR